MFSNLTNKSQTKKKEKLNYDHARNNEIIKSSKLKKINKQNTGIKKDSKSNTQGQLM